MKILNVFPDHKGMFIVCNAKDDGISLCITTSDIRFLESIGYKVVIL